MADSIVLALQREVLDRSVPVSDLLRKALLIARKLQLSEFEAWVSRELNGYKGEDVPDYRELRGQPHFRNPYRGWEPIAFDADAAELAENLSKNRCFQSVAEVEALVNGNGTLMLPYPYGLQADIGKAVGYQSQSAMFVSKSRLVAILDGVRNILLQWSLKLEQEGVLGDGVAFTNEEKRAAESSPQQINYYISGSAQFHQGTGTAVQINNAPLDLAAVSAFIGALKQQLPSLGLAQNQKSEVVAEVASVEAQVSSPKPKHTIVREGLKSLRNILEGAGGGVATQLLIQLGQLLGGG